MSTRTLKDFSVGASKGLLTIGRFIACLIFVLATSLYPAKDAQAETVFEVLDKVCKQLPDLCGKVEPYTAVVDACFKKKDELGCALAIINVATGDQIGSAKSQVEAVLSCIKAAPKISDQAKFTAACQTYLDAAGVSSTKVNEVYGIVNTCKGVDDLDDAIYCADYLLDSSFVDDVGLKVPTWVNSLFDIYIDIDKKDYWGLVKDVGATIACAVANYFLGADVCAFLEDVAAVGKAIIGAFGEVVDFVSDLFSSGGTTYKIHGKEVGVAEFLTYMYGHEPTNPKGYLNGSVQARMEGEKEWKAHKAAVILAARNGVFKSSFNQMTEEFANDVWTVYAQRDVYPEWDKRTRTFIPLRKEAIEKSAVSISGSLTTQLLNENDETTRRKLITDTYKTCINASLVYSEKLIIWTKEGRSGGGEGVTDVTSSCSYAMGQKMIPTGPDACVLKLQPNKEAFSARCKSAKSERVCEDVRGIVGSAAVTGCSGGDPTTIVAQVEMIKWQKEKRFESAGLKCSYDLFWNTKAIGCSDSLYVTQCNALLTKEFGNKGLDFPKAGVMDCQLRRSPDQKKWGDVVPQVAQALTPGFNFDVNINAPINAPAANNKQPECTVDAKDLLIVQCPGRPASNSGGYKLAEQLLGKGRVRECTTADRSLSPHWVETPCIIWNGMVVFDDVAGKIGTTVAKVGVDSVKTNVAVTAAAGGGTLAKDLKTDASKVNLTGSNTARTGLGVNIGAATTATTGKAPQTTATGNLSDILKGGTVPSVSALGGGNAAKAGATAALAAPVASAPKVDEAALRNCKAFLGRKDEMLCSDARSFAACKSAVDIGQMKTCRIAGSADVYSKR